MVTIEVLVTQLLLSTPGGRVVLYLEVAHILGVAQTLFRASNLAALGMMLHTRLKVVRPRPATKRSTDYIVNNLIGKFL